MAVIAVRKGSAKAKLRLGGRHTKSLGEVSASGAFGLEEQSLVLLGGESNGHLTTQRSAIATGTVSVLGEGVVNLLVGHDWSCMGWYGYEVESGSRSKVVGMSKATMYRGMSKEDPRPTYTRRGPLPKGFSA